MTYDRVFDGIVIGGGHQGLVCAAYMAKAGRDVLVLESDMHVGGGVKTRDTTGLGFRFNLCAKGHYSIPDTPWYKDLDLAERGARYLQAGTDAGYVPGEGPPILLAKDTDRAVETIAEYSEADAERFRELRGTADDLMREIYLPQRYDEPLPADEREDLLAGSALGETFLEWSGQPVIELLQRWFESEEMIMLMMHQMSMFGEPGEGYGAPSHMGGIARCFTGEYGYGIPRGGAEMLAIALQQAVQQNGGTVLTHCPVRRIEIDDGQVTGVHVEDGRRLGAEEFVASGINPKLTFRDLVGLADLPERFASAVEDFEFETWSTVHTHFALEEAPEYSGTGEYDPNEAAFQLVGADSIEELGEGMEAVMQQSLPKGDSLGVNVMTKLDPSQAPPGKHVATAMAAAPYELDGDPTSWQERDKEMRDHFLETWRQYAPNMTEDNVIDSYSTTPQRIAAWNPNMQRGRTHLGELNAHQVLSNHFGYRTPIDGLFMCGSSSHPGAGINGGAGYVAAKVIHEELGIDPWWEPVDFRAQLASLA